MSDYLGGDQGAGYRYGTNARSVSLGNALSCDQITGFNAFANPALLSKAESIEIGSSYFLMSLDRYVHAISVSRNLSSFGGASLSYFESGVSDIQGKDFSNESTGYFSSKNSYLMFSFGSKVFSNSYVGINVRALFLSIDNQKSNGFGGDLGLLHEFSDKLSFSLVINNIFNSNVWDETNLSDNLPQINRFGARWNLNNNIKIHSMIEHTNTSGLEIYRFKNGLEMDRKNYSLRLGFVQRKGQFSNELLDFKVLAGLGIDINFLQSNKIRLDYCIDFGKENEGISNLVSLSIK